MCCDDGHLGFHETESNDKKIAWQIGSGQLIK